jgi:2-oxoisovalerate dehydrogenase E1 component
MLDAIRDVLRFRLETNPDVILFGEDIEDPKGDVFGVTRGLSTDFPDRVENAPLSESTILGVCIGRAMAGKQPVAMLQFADFIPLVFNQLSQELAPYLWRTKGTLAAPVILMAPAGAYRAGLGPKMRQACSSRHSRRATLLHSFTRRAFSMIRRRHRIASRPRQGFRLARRGCFPRAAT